MVQPVAARLQTWEQLDVLTVVYFDERQTESPIRLVQFKRLVETEQVLIKRPRFFDVADEQRDMRHAQNARPVLSHQQRRQSQHSNQLPHVNSTFIVPLRAASAKAPGASLNVLRSLIMSCTLISPRLSSSSAGSNRPHRDPMSVISFTITGAVSMPTRSC